MLYLLINVVSFCSFPFRFQLDTREISWYDIAEKKRMKIETNRPSKTNSQQNAGGEIGKSLSVIEWRISRDFHDGFIQSSEQNDMQIR